MQIAYAAVNHAQIQPRSARAHPATIILGGDHKSILCPFRRNNYEWVGLFGLLFRGLSATIAASRCLVSQQNALLRLYPRLRFVFFCVFFFFFPKDAAATLDARKKCEALQDCHAKPEKLKDSPSILIRTNEQKYLLLCYPKYNNKLDRHCSHQKIQENAILLQENVTWKDV